MVHSRDRDDTLNVFIHIPKTAGTSFNTLLTREFGSNRILHAPDSAHDSGYCTYRSIAAPEKARVRLLRGHILHGIDKHIQRGVNYFTILREPISRIRSFLNHMASEAAVHPRLDTPWYSAIRDWHDAKSYVQRRPYDIDNYMVRALSGIDFSAGECSDLHLKAAKQNLDQMLAFGIQERLAESAVLLAQELNWRVVPVLSRTKSNNLPRIQLTQTDVATLRDLNYYDLQLYSYASQRFDRIVNETSVIRRRGYIYSKATPLVSMTERVFRAVRGR